MFKKELLIPALIGLGVYTQNSEINLCNNTTMLLLLFALLEGDFCHKEEHEHCDECNFVPYRRARTFDECDCECDYCRRKQRCYC